MVFSSLLFTSLLFSLASPRSIEINRMVNLTDTRDSLASRGLFFFFLFLFLFLFFLHLLILIHPLEIRFHSAPFTNITSITIMPLHDTNTPRHIGTYISISFELNMNLVLIAITTSKTLFNFGFTIIVVIVWSYVWMKIDNRKVVNREQKYVFIIFFPFLFFFFFVFFYYYYYVSCARMFSKKNTIKNITNKSL